LAAQEHLQLLSQGAKLEKIEGFPGALRARFSERQDPVSIVIPTAFKRNPLRTHYVDLLIRSLVPFIRTDLGDELILVNGGEEKSAYVKELLNDARFRVVCVTDNDRFNFSQRCNIGFLTARNQHVLLLNDDVEFGSENPLNSLFGILSLPDVGLVGGLLSFPDYKVQHGGHAFTGGNPHHIHYGANSLKFGLMDLVVDHEVVGVTAALMFQLKSTWQAVGGFTTSLPLNFNDVDYCQKIRSLGFSIIQANSVLAIHHESVTREPEVKEWELTTIRQRWPEAIKVDSFSTTQRH
jgi:GT2 family glycosyltransferase